MPAAARIPDPLAASDPGTARIASSRNHAALVPVAAGVHYLTVGFVNLYVVGDPESGWILVDTGLPGTAAFTRGAVARLLGAGARPRAIVLTHGHFDHAGSARALAEEWDTPVYAHPLELPYLTGRSDYPPQDPTMGGAIAQMSRLFPHTGFDLRPQVRPLPDDGSVPEAPGWRWLHTPGHTHGHVSLFREANRVLLAGDAFATMDMDSWTAHATERRELDRPAAPFTSDWGAAGRSVQSLARLEPETVAAGHGIPVAGPQVAPALHRLAERFPVPRHGRYVGRPARADERGVTEVPPPVPDPLPARLAGAAALAAAGYLAARSFRRGRG
ncbi:MAG: MBL fold metallo-hydrolase [Gemmatimonadota bacterium]